MTSNARLLKYPRLDPVDLSGNARHQTAAKHALKIYRANAIYTFIPKNACSTMRLSLAVENGCIDGPSGIDWIHENNWTFRASLEDLILACYTFVILRDPFARLASCFLDKIVGRHGPARGIRDLVGPDLDLDAITFADFVRFMEDPVIRAGNMHWRPQTDFLVYENYDDYFALENFATAGATITARTGMEILDARSLTLHGLDRYRLLPREEDHAHTPARVIAELRSRGLCPDPKSLFTPSIARAAASCFSADIEVYARKTGLPLLFPDHAAS